MQFLTRMVEVMGYEAYTPPADGPYGDFAMRPPGKGEGLVFLVGHVHDDREVFELKTAVPASSAAWPRLAMIETADRVLVLVPLSARQKSVSKAQLAQAELVLPKW